MRRDTDIYLYTFFSLSLIYILADEGLGTVDTHDSMALMVLGRCVGGILTYPSNAAWCLYIYIHFVFFLLLIHILGDEGLRTIYTHDLMPLMVLGRF